MTENKKQYEYYKHKYETTSLPSLKKYYRLRMEDHTPGCALDMIENYAPCRCGIDKDKDEI